MPVLKVRPRDILTHGLSEIMKYEALILSLCLISFAHKSYVDLYILSFKSVLLIEPIYIINAVQSNKMCVFSIREFGLER